MSIDATMFKYETLIFCRGFFAAVSPQEVIDMLRKEISNVLNSGDRKFFRSIEKTLYSVTTQTAEYNEEKYVIFYFTASKQQFIYLSSDV